jgi:hypothetical protein
MTHLNYTEVARDADLAFKSVDFLWRVDWDSPHITEFSYDVYVSVDPEEEGEEEDVVADDHAVLDDEGVPMRRIGAVRGYLISHDGTDRRLNIWDEADALDGELEAYVSQIRTELKACRKVFAAPQIEDFLKIVVVQDFESADGIDSVAWIAKVVATLAQKEMPNLMLVDPRVMPDQPGEMSATRVVQASWSDAAKLKGHAHAEALAELGLTQMVCAGHMWGWSKGELMKKYSREALLGLKSAGALVVED